MSSSDESKRATQMGGASVTRAKSIQHAVVSTAQSFFAHEPFQLAAALSYYSLLSIAPLLLVVTGAFGLLIDEAWFREEIVRQADALVGPDGAGLLSTVMEHSQKSDSSVWSLLVGSALTLLGATTVFAQLQSALNRIFEVSARATNAFSSFLRARLVSLGVVLGLGFLMLVSLLASAAVSGIQELAAAQLDNTGWLWSAVNIGLAFLLLTGFMAMLFKYVPDVSLDWRHTWIGAVTTAALFTLGKYVIGLYLGTAGVGSAFGAAGSAVVFMVWVYYASLILFVGAEITSSVAGNIRPKEFASVE